MTLTELDPFTLNTDTTTCRSVGCEQPASWVLVLRCCTTRPTYLCDRHRLKLYTALATRPVLCRWCEATPEITREERLT